MHSAGSQEAQRLGGVPALGALEASQEVLPVACCVTRVRAHVLSGAQPLSMGEVNPCPVPRECALCHVGEPGRSVLDKMHLKGRKH